MLLFFVIDIYYIRLCNDDISNFLNDGILKINRDDVLMLIQKHSRYSWYAACT